MHTLQLDSFSARATLGVVLAFHVAGGSALARDNHGAVYTMTNATAGNSVVMYNRSANGELGGPHFIPTEGMGTGGGLGSQGAVKLSENGRWLLVANAGSNDVTVFSTRRGTLEMTDRQSSGGMMPISIATHDGVVFVLNAGGSPNITGFYLSSEGRLIPMPASTRQLPGAAPAQVSFANNGATLVVTEKDSNTIVTFSVDDDMVSAPQSHPSAGMTPFGFAVSRMDVLVVSDASGGAQRTSTVSSYIAGEDGGLERVTAALATGETAACWVAVTRNGKYAYVANTGSGSISSVRVGRDGTLTLLEAAASRTPPGTAAIDLALSNNSRYLYSLAGGTISVFRVTGSGELLPVQVATGLPTSTAGLTAW